MRTYVARPPSNIGERRKGSMLSCGMTRVPSASAQAPDRPNLLEPMVQLARVTPSLRRHGAKAKRCNTHRSREWDAFISDPRCRCCFSGQCVSSRRWLDTNGGFYFGIMTAASHQRRADGANAFQSSWLGFLQSSTDLGAAMQTRIAEKGFFVFRGQ